MGLVGQELALPADWAVRLDTPQEAVSGQEATAGQFRYERMPPGWHMTTTTAGVTLLPRGRSVEGPWGIEVELFLFSNPSDAPLGVVVEAADRAPGTMALQFLLRADGAASLVAVHDGQAQEMVPWTHDTAVAPHGGTDVVKYVLRVMHQAETLSFAINGTTMLSVPTGGEDHRSIPGLRLGPGLNVHVSRFDLVTPLAPPRPPRAP
jgi:hypothetical protein